MRTRARTRKTAAALACALVWLLACVLLPACRRRERSATTEWLDPEPAPAIEGLGVRKGTTFRLADQRGKVVLVSFGYTSCMEICPDTFSKVRAVFRDLGDAAKDVVFVYVTIDPERDKPEPFRAFLETVDPRFEGLYLEGEPLAKLMAAYHVVARKRLPDPARYAKRDVDPSAFYSMDHTSGFWVVDGAGKLRIRYQHEATAAELLDGTRRLLDEGGHALHVDAPVARVLSTGAGALYLTVVNDGSASDRLESAESPGALDAQLHEVVRDGELTTMRAVPRGFEIPAHARVALERGGKHIMLFGVKDAATATRLSVTLHFAHAGAVVLDVPVRHGIDDDAAPTGPPAAPPVAAARRQLRVCADGNNLPFSNERGEGFENKLATLIAADLDADVAYTWAPQRRGFFRETLKANRCDVVMGVPADLDMVATTNPYYRSGYVFVYGPQAPHVRSLDAPELRHLRIGVPLVGDDGANPPPVLALAPRDLIANLHGYSVYGNYRKESPPADLMRALRRGDIDIAIAWGPLAGYYATRPAPALDLAVIPEAEAPKGLTFAFDIAMGVRRADKALAAELNGVLAKRKKEIAALLDSYGVPRL